MSRRADKDSYVPPTSVERHLEIIALLAERPGGAPVTTGSSANLCCPACSRSWYSAAPDFWIGRPCLAADCASTIERPRGFEDSEAAAVTQESSAFERARIRRDRKRDRKRREEGPHPAFDPYNPPQRKRARLRRFSGWDQPAPNPPSRRAA